MIEIKNLTKIYKSKKGLKTTAINNINLKIANKGMLFITGKSGSGKSTLLNLLGGLDDITEGQILINGHDISKFTKDEYDSYRNTYIGFIFQEFNILEQYNVYENIELSKKLQNQNIKKEDIDKLLDKLGLNNLGSRKISELSGGQKQRIAIARALIKDPFIILADEPTGNLDRKSSEQIFNILKEISKEKLVIVVSHDLQSALKYGDRIIEIEDGNIINDSLPTDKIETNPFVLKKSKLPLQYALKMAFSSFKNKPFKLCMTVLLTTISLIFMGFTFNCMIFDKTMLIVNTMKENNDYVYNVEKAISSYSGMYEPLNLEENDIDYIKNKINDKFSLSYNLYDNSQLLNFEFGENNLDIPFYTNYFSPKFVELNDSRILNKIIGSEPKENNEIVVHKYFADYIIKFGIKTSNDELYFPKDYDDIINSKKQIKLGQNKVIITGIIDDNNTMFEDIKNETIVDDEELMLYLQKYKNKANDFYVKGFTNSAILGASKEKCLDFMYIKKKNLIEDGIESGNIKTLNNEIDAITKDGIKSINSLEKNEIIISIDKLQLFNKTMENEINEYFKENRNLTYNDALAKYIEQYLKNNDITLYLNYYGMYNMEEDIQVKVIGVSLDDISYVSEKYLEEIEPITKLIYSVKIFDNNTNNLTNSFKNLVFKPINNLDGTYYNYSINAGVDSDISNVISTYKTLNIYILIISLVFILFTFLLFSNFIYLSISYCKKEIGILRALGARNKDVIKIFGYESLTIGILSWIISIIGWFIVCSVLNKSLFGKLYYTLNGIVTHPLVPILMFIYVIVIAIIITAVSISRINKIKPIDAIKN